MNALPDTQSIELKLDGSWLTIWFNQPEKRNPLTDTVVNELLLVTEYLVSESSIRGVTFRGHGGVFCAGGDLKEFRALAEGTREATLAVSAKIGELLRRVNALPQVTIALIEGAAMAGGLGLACCCDVAMGTEDAKFAFSETRIGITPAQIARYVLQKCGYATGRRLMVTAARFTGEEAQRLGVLDACVPNPQSLTIHEQSLRRDVLACAPGAVAACKVLIRGLDGLPENEAVQFAAGNFTDCLQGDEGLEGVASFLEKRKPDWHVEI